VSILWLVVYSFNNSFFRLCFHWFLDWLNLLGIISIIPLFIQFIHSLFYFLSLFPKVSNELWLKENRTNYKKNLTFFFIRNDLRGFHNSLDEDPIGMAFNHLLQFRGSLWTYFRWAFLLFSCWKHDFFAINCQLQKSYQALLCFLLKRSTNIHLYVQHDFLCE
jgi:hypothetical protein